MIITLNLFMLEAANYKAKVLRSAFTTLSPPKLRDYADGVIEKMDGNKDYEALQPLVDALKLKNTELKSALTTVEHGGNKDQIATKNQIANEVKLCLDAFELPLNYNAKGDPLYIFNAGFSCWKVPVRSELKPPQQPQKIEIIADPKTQGGALVTFSCSNDKSIQSVLAFVSTDGVEFIQHGTLSRTGGLLTGLPRLQEISIYLVTVGRQGLQSEPTVPVRLAVV